MATPIATYAVYSAPTGDTSTLTTPSFTPSNGELIIVKLSTWDTGSGMNAPTGGGQTYTSVIIGAPGNFNGWVGIYKATISGSPGSMTISASPVGNTSHMMVVERWPVGSTVGASATAEYGGTQTATWSTNITCTGTNGNVSWVMVDEVSADPATRAYTPAGTTEDGLQDGHIGANAVLYAAYFSTTSSGSYSYGMTAPGFLDWNTAAVEIIPPAASAGTSAPDLSQIPWPVLQQLIMAADTLNGLDSSQGSVPTVAETGIASAGISGTAVAVKKVAQTGIASAGVSGSAIEVKRATPTATASAGLSGASTAVKKAPESGTSSAGVSGSGTQVKKAPETGTASAGVSGYGTTKKTAVETGTASAGISGYGAENKKTAQTGIGSAGISGYGPTQGGRPQTGRASAGISGTVVHATTRARAGIAAAGLSGSGTQVKKTAQTGTVSTGLSGYGTTKKIAKGVATASAGLAGRATAVKKSPEVGTASVGISGYGNQVKKTALSGRSCAGLSGYGPTKSGFKADRFMPFFLSP